MKERIIYFIFLILFNKVVFSQDTKTLISKNDELSSKSGSIIEKDYNTFITIKRMDIQLVKTTDHTKGDSSTTVRFEFLYKSPTNEYIRDSKFATIEKKELPDLIKAAKQMEEQFFKNVYKNYKECEYTCSSGLKIGGYVDTDKSNIWVRYITLESTSNSSVYFTGPEFRELIMYLEKIYLLMDKE
jgi:hypothetical protein